VWGGYEGMADQMGGLKVSSLGSADYKLGSQGREEGLGYAGESCSPSHCCSLRAGAADAEVEAVGCCRDSWRSITASIPRRSKVRRDGDDAHGAGSWQGVQVVKAG
jgi:hypothetical protein